MKKIILLASVILTVALVFTACNKTKIYANRLDGGDWKVTELSVDGTNEAELPKWTIGDCDAYKESCTGDWKNDHNHTAKFAWQFREKGKKFEISNQSKVEDVTAGLTGDMFFHAEELADQCVNFSGTYEVVEHKRKMMEFKSTTTIGFSGKTVIIKIEKE